MTLRQTGRTQRMIDALAAYLVGGNRVLILVPNEHVRAGVARRIAGRYQGWVLDGGREVQVGGARVLLSVVTGDVPRGKVFSPAAVYVDHTAWEFAPREALETILNNDLYRHLRWTDRVQGSPR